MPEVCRRRHRRRALLRVPRWGGPRDHNGDDAHRDDGDGDDFDDELPGSRVVQVLVRWPRGRLGEEVRVAEMYRMRPMLREAAPGKPYRVPLMEPHTQALRHLTIMAEFAWTGASR